MKLALVLSVILNLYLLYFIAKRFYYNKVPPVLWTYDIAMLGDSHIERGNWGELLDMNVANFGKGKSTVQQMYTRLPGVINCKPKVCFIHGGINDIVNEVPLDTTLVYYNKIITELKAAGIKPVIITVMKTTDRYYDKAIDTLNLHLKTLAPVVCPEILPGDLDDGLHMKGSGYIKWAGEIKEYLEGR